MIGELALLFLVSLDCGDESVWGLSVTHHSHYSHSTPLTLYTKHTFIIHTDWLKFSLVCQWTITGEQTYKHTNRYKPYNVHIYTSTHTQIHAIIISAPALTLHT